MSRDLAGRVAVVTGASRGVGRQIAAALVRADVAVASVSRSGSDVGLSITADISRIEEVARIKDSIERTLGPPTILVNAAGVFGPIQLIKDSDPALWLETLMVNTVSAYLTCRAFVQGMIDAKWGRVVNVTSAASLHPPTPLNSAYATSKVALNQFTRNLASELIGTGVTANVLHPGDLKTAMWTYIDAQLQDLGPEADTYRDWVTWVGQTGGDPIEKAAQAALSIIAGSSNGMFHWIHEPLQPPLPSWPSQTDAEALPWKS